MHLSENLFMWDLILWDLAKSQRIVHGVVHLQESYPLKMRIYGECEAQIRFYSYGSMEPGMSLVLPLLVHHSCHNLSQSVFYRHSSVTN